MICIKKWKHTESVLVVVMLDHDYFIGIKLLILFTYNDESLTSIFEGKLVQEYMMENRVGCHYTIV